MTQDDWLKTITAYKNGNAQLFERSIMPLYRKSGASIFSIEGLETEENAWLVFSESIVKFRRKFLLGEEKIPNDINAYLHRIQKNFWIDVCRKNNKKRQVRLNLMDKSSIERAAVSGSSVTIMKTAFSFKEERATNKKRLKALEIAIEKMEKGIHKTIILEHCMEGKSLKEIKEELQLECSDSAVSQKKKTSINKLTRLFFKELNRL